MRRRALREIPLSAYRNEHGGWIASARSKMRDVEDESCWRKGDVKVACENSPDSAKTSRWPKASHFDSPTMHDANWRLLWNFALDSHQNNCRRLFISLSLKGSSLHFRLVIPSLNLNILISALWNMALVSSYQADTGARS